MASSSQANTPTDRPNEFELEIERLSQNQYDVYVRDQHISILFASTHPLTPPLSPQPPSTPSTCGPPMPPNTPPSPSTASASESASRASSFSLYPLLAASGPPAGYKCVRFELTEDQIWDQQQQPKPKLKESTVIGEPDDSKVKSVKFKLTPEQVERLHVEHPKLVEPRSFRVGDVCMGRREVLRSIVEHVKGKYRKE